MASIQTLHVGGKRKAAIAGSTVSLVAPATERPFADASLADLADMELAVQAAHSSFESGEWSGRTIHDRARLLLEACALLEPKYGEIARVQANEMGAPIKLGVATAAGVVSSARRLAQLATRLANDDERHGTWLATVLREPVGVVATISPWNGPFSMSVTKSFNALLAGCSVIDKPSTETPLDCLYWADALYEAGLPAGVFNLVPGGPSVGDYLVRHELVNMVSFTGGTESGRRIAAICGQQLKHVVLELGGKSAAVVLPDADLSVLAASVGDSLYPNAGQVCSGLSRVVVPVRFVDQVVDSLVAAAKDVIVGDPLDEATDMGPLASRRQYDRVTGYVDVGIAEGAELVAGGARPDHLDTGYFFQPTVFRGVRNNMKIAQEEIFGPVVSVITYASEDEAIAIANDSPYGLHGGIFTADVEHAEILAARFRTGSVTINGFTSNFDAPRDGVKASGLGVRGGIEGFREMQVCKTVNLMREMV